MGEPKGKLCPLEDMMRRQGIEAEVKNLLWKAKARYGTWDKLASEMGVAPVSLRRYMDGRFLPNLEVYFILCECAESRCRPGDSPDDSGDFLLAEQAVVVMPRRLFQWYTRVSCFGAKRVV